MRDATKEIFDGVNALFHPDFAHLHLKRETRRVGRDGWTRRIRSMGKRVSRAPRFDDALGEDDRRQSFRPCPFL